MKHVEVYLAANTVTPKDQIGGSESEFDFEPYGVVFRHEPNPDGLHTRIIPWGMVREVRISNVGSN